VRRDCIFMCDIHCRSWSNECR